MKQIHLEMIRVTEAAAIKAAELVGSGDKLAIDKAATDAMKSRLNKIDFLARVAIGEGKKDNSHGLFKNEYIGAKQAHEKWMAMFPYYDLAVDPVEGTTPSSKGGYEAMSVLALANRECMLATEEYYMNKLVAGPEISSKVKLDLHKPLNQLIDEISAATNKPYSRITFCVLDRPRHDNIIKQIRAKGCRIKLIQDCDVTGAIATCFPESNVDILIGVGGSPEGIISAAALKCLGGWMQGQLCNLAGVPITDEVYEIEELVKGDTIFCATGITNGSLLKGVRYINNRPITNSVLMRSESKTTRFIEATHGN